jgi:hypothetical protein
MGQVMLAVLYSLCCRSQQVVFPPFEDLPSMTDADDMIDIAQREFKELVS